MPTGSLTLAQIVERTDSLNVGCTRCTRSGRYPLATLTERHGPEFGVPDLLRLLSLGCPMRKSVSAYDLCGIFCPDLPALFEVSKPPAAR